MSVKKQKYRRLQVENIALRTVVEIVLLVIAIVICGTAVVKSYEKSYAGATVENAGLNAMQLAHNISAMADPKALKTDNVDRRDYVQENYSRQLENCFIDEDIEYSGGIYMIKEGDISLFASSSAYKELLASLGDSQDINEALQIAAAGQQTSIHIDDTYIAFWPITDLEDGGKVCAISSAAIDYRSATEFDSPVKSRIVLISVVSGVLILAYFAVSAVRSERRKMNGEAV